MMRRTVKKGLVLPFGLSALLLFVVGCIPLTQYRVSGNQGYDNFGYYEELGYGVLQIGPSNKRKTSTVIDGQSYATAPEGTRVGIITEPHPFDVETGKLYVRDRVYLCGADGKRISRKWKNGRWVFHFALRTPHGNATKEFQVDLWTFYYNPIIHGPPN